jgi:hypothetical protein
MRGFDLWFVQGQVKACGALSSLALGTSLTASSFDTASLSMTSLVREPPPSLPLFTCPPPAFPSVLKYNT